MRFSNILTKIGNGDMLMLNEKVLLENQFESREQSVFDAPNAIRLFHRNHDVEETITWCLILPTP
jgi:hypothetical protein